MLHFHIIFLVNFIAMDYLIIADDPQKIYKNIGYTVSLCLNYSATILNGTFQDGKKYSFQCISNNTACGYGNKYLCQIPCNNEGNKLKIKGGRVFSLTPELFYPFIIPSSNKNNIYHNNDELRLDTETDLSLFQSNEIEIVFLNESNINCGNLEIRKNYIICTINLDHVHHYGIMSVNVRIRYGSNICNQTNPVGIITLQRETKLTEFMKKHYWILLIAAIFLLIICGCTFIYKTKIYRRRYNQSNLQHKKELDEQEYKLVKTQKKAFLECQTANDLFPDLGSLRPRYILSFDNFVSRIFNIELSVDSTSQKSHMVEDFQTIILNKDSLIQWIQKVESSCKVQQRSLIASLLSIVLFQHPIYFLELIKCLLTKYIEQMKIKNEERLLFRRSDSIIEKLIGNWITLCLYRSLKNGEVGKKFFDLYRAIKCKINQGIVDCLTNKAKYALTFDHIMRGDIDYEVIKIKAEVNVNLKMLSHLSKPLKINLECLDVEVLSLDSISQVKGKILDRAIMVFSEKEQLKNIKENCDLSVGPIEIGEFRLQFMNNNIKIMLDDFDRTSVSSINDKSCLMVNTMKHYKIKSGMKFLLDSSNVLYNIKTESTEEKPLSSPKTIMVHLQLPENYKVTSIDSPTKNQIVANGSKVLFNPVSEEMNKESYLMLLMATKQSVLAFVDSFFQCIFNWNPNQAQGTSSNSLFCTDEQFVVTSLNNEPQYLVTKESYLKPIYYLFAMLDDIAKNLSITDETAVLAWKSNSFILRFWVNLIKNPNFIFSVDKTAPIDGSLTTIASTLMESCSTSVANTLVDVNLPVVKQLFLKELKRYSTWWKYFAESGTQIEESCIVQMMENIVKTYDMANHYNSSLASLQAISNTLIQEQ